MASHREIYFDPLFQLHWGGSHALDRKNYDGELEVLRVKLDRGGYTSSGRYFGVGAPLFEVYGDHGVSFYMRAKDYSSAKKLVRTGYPKAKIGR